MLLLQSRDGSAPEKRWLKEPKGLNLLEYLIKLFLKPKAYFCKGQKIKTYRHEFTHRFRHQIPAGYF
jgi:hypothetical protein